MPWLLGWLCLLCAFGSVFAQTDSIRVIHLAGNGESGFSGDGGPATEASLVRVSDVYVDLDQNVYLSDLHNHRIRKINADGVITTVAGNGAVDFRGNGLYGGDGRPATEASLNAPFGISLDSKGALYITDRFNQRIRKVSPDGMMSTLAGSFSPGFTGDGQLAASALLKAPFDVFVSIRDEIFIVDTGNQRIRRIDQAHRILTVAGNGDGGFQGAFSGDGGLATQAALRDPRSIYVDLEDNMYIADTGNRRVRKVDASGIITTVAGDGNRRSPTDGVLATETSFIEPISVFGDAWGNLYVLDGGIRSSRVVQIDTAGVLRTIVSVEAASDSTNQAASIIPDETEFYSIFIDQVGSMYVTTLRRAWKIEGDKRIGPSVLGQQNPIAQNRPPVARPDTLRLKSGQLGKVFVMNNDWDPDGDPMQLLSVSPGIHSSEVTVHEDGSVRYQADEDFVGTDQVTYTVRDVHGATAGSKLWVIVEPENYIPTAVNDTVEVKPNSRVNVYVLRNDSDLDPDPIEVIGVTEGKHSERIVINSNGTIHYRPVPGYEGPDEFAYTISDGQGGTATATVYVLVVDHPPQVNRTLQRLQLFVGRVDTVDLGGLQPVIWDPQHEPLTLIVESSDTNVVGIVSTGYKITVSGKMVGLASINVTGIDSIGQSASTSFDVIVKDPTPQIGHSTIGGTLNLFERSFASWDRKALTGPASVDTIGDENLGAIYVSNLSVVAKDPQILALRGYIDQLLLRTLITRVSVHISTGAILQEQDTVATVEALIRSESSDGPRMVVKQESFTLKILKVSGLWVIDDMVGILDRVAVFLEMSDHPKISWLIPDLTLAANGPPIVIGLNDEPYLFRTSVRNSLTYGANINQASSNMVTDVSVQDNQMILSPQSSGEAYILIQAQNAAGDARSRFKVVVRDGVPVAMPDSVLARSNEVTKIMALDNDMSSGALQVVSVTDGAKSKSNDVVDGTAIYYIPQADAEGTDWFTYRVSDQAGRQSDGFVYVQIEAAEVIPSPDFDGDGLVRFSDFLLFSQAYLSKNAQYDLDGDGVVGFSDFLIFAQAYTG